MPLVVLRRNLCDYERMDRTNQLRAILHRVQV